MKILLYGHGGSKNHGCEAIVRATHKVMKNAVANLEVSLVSHDLESDLHFNINDLCKMFSIKQLVRFSPRHIWYRVLNICTGSEEHYRKFYFTEIFKNKSSLYFSIGGDNYCYDGYQWLADINHRLNMAGKKTVLWGCSVEPDLLELPDVIQDMNRYALIIARESITYDAFIKAGISNNTHLIPDPAFTLDTVELPLPEGFAKENTIGINVSPLIMKCEQVDGATKNNFVALIKHIINSTDMQIALIPHVVNDGNDDRETLNDLYNIFKDTNRVVNIADSNCMELKGYISRCRMFIGARTHATIAAYSTCVPTLTVGYSVKAKGIAKDIFGTDENYVVPVQTLENENDLVNAFEWLKDNEMSIRDYLNGFMPTYIEKVWQAGIKAKALCDAKE